MCGQKRAPGWKAWSGSQEATHGYSSCMFDKKRFFTPITEWASEPGYSSVTCWELWGTEMSAACLTACHFQSYLPALDQAMAKLRLCPTGHRHWSQKRHMCRTQWRASTLGISVGVIGEIGRGQMVEPRGFEVPSQVATFLSFVFMCSIYLSEVQWEYVLSS